MSELPKIVSAGCAEVEGRVDSIRGGKAICTIEINSEALALPIELDATLLEAHDLKPGDRFMYTMTRDGPIRKEQIRPLPKALIVTGNDGEYQRLLNEMEEPCEIVIPIENRRPRSDIGKT